MDMRRHVATWINDTLLVRLDGRYEGVINGVTEQVVRNPFTAQRELHPVIVFPDGHRLIPNISMRRALIEMLGAQTDAWVGRRIVVTRRRVERTNRETGKVTPAWEKAVSCPDVHARVPCERRDGSADATPITADDTLWIGALPRCGRCDDVARTDAVTDFARG